MKNILLCLISFSFLIADIHINGDARVRPRYDITENGDGTPQIIEDLTLELGAYKDYSYSQNNLERGSIDT